MADTVQVQVSLGLQQAISQAEALRKILNESVKPDSSAYREITNMLDKATRQADMFKQTMGESLKTSSGTKTFTNNLQKTFDLLGAATSKLSTLKGHDLIFSADEVKKIQDIQNRIQQLNENVNRIRSGKIDGFFNDSTVAQFKNVQEVAKKLGTDLNQLSFDGLQRKISKEMDTVNQRIESTTDQIKQLDNVLKNTNLNDLNKLTQGLSSKAAESTVEVFKGDNLTEAAGRLQAFYQQYSDYHGKMKSKIEEGGSVSQVLENENKAINSNLSTQIAQLNNYRQQLENALGTLRNISGHKAGQSREYKRNILNETGMQDLFKAVGFNEVLANTGDPNGFIMHAREAISNALQRVTVQVSDLSNLRESMLESLKSIFDGLETETAIDDAAGLKRAISAMLSTEGVDIKNNVIANALAEIKKDADITQVIQNITNAVKTYLDTLQQDASGATLRLQELQTYWTNLSNASTTVDGAIERLNEIIREQGKEIKNLKKQLDDYTKAKAQGFRQQIVNDPSIQQAEQDYTRARQALEAYTNGLAKLESQQKVLGGVQTAVVNWMGFNQVLNLTRRAVDEMKNHIQELDAVMTQIAVVTNMTQQDLWSQIGIYSEIARQYGVAIKGVYEVSQIFYQQGLATQEVMNLTTETLKMARIAGIDYATAADYMTTAIRGFKLEMSEANHVTDVWSALAARTASDTEELATAISKTASSAEAVGSSFEATSAMIATMVSVTRESATNIGTALKSVISRYGEMTGDPSKLVDSEGQEMSLNRVDKALKTIGITIQDVNGQFRDFDDVILELAEKWDTLDSLSQRYIATLMAGNRFEIVLAVA